jgi:hypothetical protein
LADRRDLRLAHDAAPCGSRRYGRAATRDQRNVRELDPAVGTPPAGAVELGGVDPVTPRVLRRRRGGARGAEQADEKSQDRGGGDRPDGAAGE